MTSPMSGALHRAIHRSGGAAEVAAERCELCGLAVPGDHRHVLDEGREEPLCVCRACALLFAADGAAQGRYRLIPDTRMRLPDLVSLDLGVPVGLVFFVRRQGGAVVAHYPSPAGATRWEVRAGAWAELEQRCPPVRDLLPGVQALLANTVRGHREYWLVPVDDCYRLVALIRREWRGLSGGSTVWPAIEGFFADLNRIHDGRE